MSAALLAALKRTIGQRLLMARTSAGLTVDDAAALLCLDDVDVLAFENGTRQPHSALLPRFAELYGCTVPWLLGEDEPEQRTEAWLKLAADALRKLTPEQQEEAVRLARGLGGGT